MSGSKFLSFLSGILVGGLIGAAASLLMAEKPGTEVQAELKREVDGVLEEGRRAAAVRRAELERQLAEVRGDPPQSR